MTLPENTNSYFPNFIEEEENIIPKQFIIGGESEDHNFISLPLHPSEEKLVLTSHVEENSSLLDNKNDNLDILTGEATRKASEIFSNTWDYVQDMLLGEPIRVGDVYKEDNEYIRSSWGSVAGRRSFWEVLNPYQTNWRSSDSFEFRVDANTDIQLGVKNPPFRVDVKLLEIGEYSNIIASGVFEPNNFDNPLSYPLLVPGKNYILQVEYPTGWSVPRPTEIVLNMDQAGESFWDARQLGDITRQRIAINDFVGTNKGDFADFYQFSVSEPRSLSYKVHEYDNLIDVEVFDNQGNNIIPNETIIGAFSDKQGAFVHYLLPGNYFAKVSAPINPDLHTNYEVVFNLESPPLLPAAPDPYMDQAGENFWNARQLGDITRQRIAINDFVGTNKGDFADFYQFSISEPRSLSYKVHEYYNLIDVEVFDDQGRNIIPDETIIGAFSNKQGAFVHFLSSGNYFAKVSAPTNPDLYTTYEVVFNLESPPMYPDEPFDESYDDLPKKLIGPVIYP
jgi:hypothetical protein